MSISDTASLAPRKRPRDRKQIILAKASKLFIAQGYHQVSMADIADAVGVTPTALYRHYKNKEELLEQVLLTAAVGVRDTVVAACADGRPTAEVLADLSAFAFAARGVHPLLRREVRHLPASQQRAVAVLIVEAVRAIGGVVAAARPDLAPHHCRLVAWYLIWMLGSISYHRVEVAEDDGIHILRRLADDMIGALPVPQPYPQLITAGEAERLVQADASGERREELIAAATTLFGEQGYVATTIEDVAARAGMVGPSIYHYFPRKSDLLKVILDRCARWIDGYIARAVTESGAPDDIVRAMMRYYAEFSVAHPGLIAVAATEPMHLSPDINAGRTRDIQRDGVVSWATLLQYARPGMSRAEARLRVIAATTVANNAVLRRPFGLQHADDLTAVGHAILAVSVN